MGHKYKLTITMFNKITREVSSVDTLKTPPLDDAAWEQTKMLRLSQAQTIADILNEDFCYSIGTHRARTEPTNEIKNEGE